MNKDIVSQGVNALIHYMGTCECILTQPLWLRVGHQQ
jgi:hypothetical protein